MLCSSDTPQLVAQLIAICKRHLALPASSRGIAAVLLARLLTRPDTAAALQAFVSWCTMSLSTANVGGRFLVPGITPTCAYRIP